MAQSRSHPAEELSILLGEPNTVIRRRKFGLFGHGVFGGRGNARSGNRTRTSFRKSDFKSEASAVPPSGRSACQAFANALGKASLRYKGLKIVPQSLAIDRARQCPRWPSYFPHRWR